MALPVRYRDAIMHYHQQDHRGQETFMNTISRCFSVRMPASGLRLLGLLLLVATAVSQPVSAQTDNPLLYEVLDRLELLEREVRQLRGELEMLQYQRQQQPDTMPSPAPAPVVPVTPPPSASSTTSPLSSLPSTQASIPSGTPPGSDVQSAYDSAFASLRSGQYEQAVSQFEDFLRRYPDSTLTPDAYYWLGESYYVLRRFEQAQQIFLTLGADFPRSDKLPDAMLKLGYIYSETGDIPRAREMLQKLIDVYPNSVAASLGASHLRSLP